MLKKRAFLFPGQGSQCVGMLSDIAGRFPVIQETFAEASHALGFDLWKLAQAGPEKTLNQTENTQPALLAASVALWRLWKRAENLFPLYMAGHSLGEYSALVCSGVLEFSTAVRLVAERGRLMQAAVPDEQGAMAAIIGLKNKEIASLCSSLSNGQILAPANYNAINQTVVAGHSVAIDRIIDEAKHLGAKLAKRLPISVPSHCALMKPASVSFAKILNTIHFSVPKIPILNNVDTRVENDPIRIKEALVRQLYSPVRWVDIIQRLEKCQIEEFVECGPGKVLAGLNKRITSIPTETVQELINFK